MSNGRNRPLATRIARAERRIARYLGADECDRLCSMMATERRKLERAKEAQCAQPTG